MEYYKHLSIFSYDILADIYSPIDDPLVLGGWHQFIKAERIQSISEKFLFALSTSCAALQRSKTMLCKANYPSRTERWLERVWASLLSDFHMFLQSKHLILNWSDPKGSSPLCLDIYVMKRVLKSTWRKTQSGEKQNIGTIELQQVAWHYATCTMRTGETSSVLRLTKFAPNLHQCHQLDLSLHRYISRHTSLCVKIMKIRHWIEETIWEINILFGFNYDFRWTTVRKSMFPSLEN